MDKNLTIEVTNIFNNDEILSCAQLDCRKQVVAFYDRVIAWHERSLTPIDTSKMNRRQTRQNIENFDTDIGILLKELMQHLFRVESVTIPKFTWTFQI